MVASCHVRVRDEQPLCEEEEEHDGEEHDGEEHDGEEHDGEEAMPYEGDREQGVGVEGLYDSRGEKRDGVG